MSAGPHTSPAYAGSEAADFLNTVFGGKEPSDHVLVWLIERKHSAWFSDLGQATAYIDQNHEKDVYIGVALSPANHGRHLRLKIEGGERLPSALVGLWADIDFVDGVHKKANLPPNADAARSVMFPDLPPSVLIHSGGGLQAWWLFKEAERLQDEAAVRDAGDLTMRWNRALRGRAAAKGWDVDSVADLTRVLRIPGTANRKIPDRPRPVRLLEINEHRYNPGELAEYLDSIAPILVPARAIRPATVSASLIYDSTVNPPFDKFIALCDAEPKFKNSWDHKRRDLKDTSASSYDMALANIAVQAGWSDQEIANLLIAHRRRYKDDLKLRDSYYTKTISKARATFGSVTENGIADAPAEIQAAAGALAPIALPQPPNVAETGKAPAAVYSEDDEDPDETPPADPLAYLKSRKAFRGIPLAGARKIGRENPHYDLILDDSRTIGLGVIDDVLSPRRARAVMAKAFLRVIPLYKQGTWDKIAQAVITLAGAGEEIVMEPSDETRSWLSSFLSTKTPLTEEQDALSEDKLRTSEKIHVDSEGRMYVSASELRNHVRINFGEVMSTQQMGARLRVLGFEGGRKGKRSWRDGKKVVTKRLWRSPVGFHPDTE